MDKMEAVLKGTDFLLEEDLELVEECKLGVRSAFNQLILKYQNKVYSIAYRMLKNKDEAKDITQDVFFSVYRSIKQFKGDSKLTTWLYRIAVNACLNRLKSKRTSTMISSEDPKVKSACDSGEINSNFSGKIEDPETAMERKDLSIILEKEISRLDEESKTVLLLRDNDGLTYEEIVFVLGIPEGTVKSRLHRARMELKQRLSKIL